MSHVCEETYIGETTPNVELRWEEHENTCKDSEPAKHFKENLSHKFSSAREQTNS